jgi:hypothetical protein
MGCPKSHNLANNLPQNIAPLKTIENNFSANTKVKYYSIMIGISQTIGCYKHWLYLRKYAGRTSGKKLNKLRTLYECFKTIFGEA